MTYPAPEQVSERSRLAAVLLCWFLGFLGIHRFYVGKVGTGVLMILTLGGVGIWALVDLVMLIIGEFRDVEGKRVWRWVEPGSLEGKTS
jgi:TM2 domain-containing membrane protein YozV